MSDIVSLLQLRKELGLSDYKIKRYMDKGLPYVTAADRLTGQAWEFSLSECQEWLDEFDEDEGNVTPASKEIEKARIRKLEVQTAREQLRLDQERGEVVPVDSVIDIVSNQFAALRSHLLSIPHKVAPLLIGYTEIDELDDVLTNYIKEALQELQVERVLPNTEVGEGDKDVPVGDGCTKTETDQ